MIYKFATMVKNSPNIGTGDVTLRNDPRVTKAGKFLRESKLNELPQLFNIFMGDISVIGPRPLMRAGFNRYSLNFQNSVYNVKPGLTGIGSIIFRDEEELITEIKNNGGDPWKFYKENIDREQLGGENKICSYSGFFCKTTNSSEAIKVFNDSGIGRMPVKFYPSAANYKPFNTYPSTSLNYSKRLSEEYICIPTHPFMSVDERDRIVEISNKL